MPGQFSDAGSNRALDAVTGRATVSTATTYLALLTSAPSDTSTLAGLAEYGAAGYSRQAVTWASPTLNGSNVPETSNTGTVSFGPFTSSVTGTITHAALVSSASGTTGNVLAWWELDASRTPSTNDSLEITGGNLKLSVD
jgi:hypothetical protein